jgi:hypothetical protein
VKLEGVGVDVDVGVGQDEVTGYCGLHDDPYTDDLTS